MTANEPAQAAETTPLLHDEQPKKQKLGPLDIPRKTRYGILAGIWLATFLAVRLFTISIFSM
jgi:hypothetical protein